MSDAATVTTQAPSPGGDDVSSVARTMYECSACRCFSSDRSSLHTHVRNTCIGANVFKIHLGRDQISSFTRVLDTEEQSTVHCKRGPVPLHVFAENILKDSVDLSDHKEWIHLVFNSEHSTIFQDINSATVYTSHELQFILFVSSIIGPKAPMRFQSVRILVTQNGKRFIAWKDANTVHVKNLNHRFLYDLLKCVYKLLRYLADHAYTHSRNLSSGLLISLEESLKRVKSNNDGDIDLEDILLYKKRDPMIRDNLFKLCKMLTITPVVRMYKI